LRDRVPADLAAHLGAQLPLLVRGAYYDQWRPSHEPEKYRDAGEFLARIAADLADIRPTNPETAARAVFKVLQTHVAGGQGAKLKDALPDEVRRLWPVEDRRAA
jgi:uncharacterized protein (DUF2267 family)